MSAIPAGEKTAQVGTGPNWARIEADYRAGLKTLRQIAEEDGNLTEAAIRKHAKRHQWVRDLKARIAAKAEALVRKEEVRRVRSLHATGSEMGAGTSFLTEDVEETTVAVNAGELARVRISHRDGARKSRSLAARLLADLEQQMDVPDLAELLLRAIAEPDPDEDKDAAKARRRSAQDALERCATTPARAQTLRTISEALRTAIALEREAWGMDEGPGEAQVRPLSDIDRAAKLASVLDRARRARQAAEDQEREAEAAAAADAAITQAAKPR